MEKRIQERLLELAEKDYQKFCSKLLPGINNILGVRIPVLRKMAKQIAKGDWRTYLKYADSKYFEEIMLQGLVIGYAKADIEEILGYVADFIPKINNWSLCDSFCCGLKIAIKNKERVWNFLLPFFNSEKEFEVRFAVVMLINYYIEREYIHRVLRLLDSIKHNGYYAKMAVAWAISTCYIKMPEITFAYLKSNNLDDFTYNKALQKIIESKLIDENMKQIMRNMKRKNNFKINMEEV